MVCELYVIVRMNTVKKQEKEKSYWRLRFGNPDFFFIAFFAIVGLDLGIERFASGNLILVLGIPIATIGIIISLFRWSKLVTRQKVIVFVLLASILLGTYLLLPGL